MGAGTRRRPEARSERPCRGGRRAGRGTGAFELRSLGAAVERPYLARLPDSYDAQVEIFEWLEGLLATCGREPALEALEYYESVGWLSGDSRESLEGFIEGLTAPEPPEPRSLDVDHHRESLRYVARLARRIDR